MTYTVPGMKTEVAGELIRLLQDRLNALNDLALTLKHVHWNVVGPNFIAVHPMLDPQVDAVRLMVDTTAERIATLGGSPSGRRVRWSAAQLGRLLDRAGRCERIWPRSTGLRGIIEAHREAIEATEEPDPVTQDMLIGQSANSSSSTGSSGPTWSPPTARW